MSKKRSPPGKEDESETDNQRADLQIEQPESYKAYHSAHSPPLEGEQRQTSEQLYDSPSRQLQVGVGAAHDYQTSEKLVKQLEDANVLLSSDGKDIFEDLP